MDDNSGTFLGLLFNEASEFIKGRMMKLRLILQNADPDIFKHCESDKRGYSFDSIHLDTYNRYAEKVCNISHCHVQSPN